MTAPSILDAHLAEIDRRLRMIQSGLEAVHQASGAPEDPVAELPPTMSGSLTPPSPSPSLIAGRPASPPPPPVAAAGRRADDAAPGGDRDEEVAAPAGDRDEEVAVLIARLSELTAAHERLLATTRDLLIEQADKLGRAAPAVSVAAGPFTDTPALQAFQRALTGLPHVRTVAVREYVGSDGVILDVHLSSPIS